MNAATPKLCWLHRLYLACFFLALALPGLLAPWWVPQEVCSPRHIWAAPDRGAALRACQGAFARDFAVGPRLLQGRIRGFYRALGASVVQQAEVGADDWLHLYGGGFSEDKCMARLAFGAGELDGWVRYFQQLQAFCAQHNIHFVLLIAPDKHTVYPETLPWRLRRAGTSRAEVLMAQLQARTTVPVLDPGPILRQRKDEGDLYHRVDTHWNELGGYFAYAQLMRHLQDQLGQDHDREKLRPLARQQVHYHCERMAAGDLAGMLQLLPDYAFPMCFVQPASAQTLFQVPGSTEHQAWRSTKAAAQNKDHLALERLTAYTDSFGGPLTKFLFGHVHEGTWIQGNRVDADQLCYHRPQVLLYEMVERRLYDAPPSPFEPPRGVLFGEGFYLNFMPSQTAPCWMGKRASAYVEHEKAQEKGVLRLVANIPPQLPPTTQLSLAVDGASAEPWAHDGHTAVRDITAAQWPTADVWHRIDVTADHTFVPAEACGVAHDRRELSISLQAQWVGSDDP